MADEQANRDSLHWQADFSRRAGSPLVARVCEALANVLDQTTATGRRFLNWPDEPRSSAIPLRLQGPFHALARSGRSPGLAAVYAGEVTDPAGVEQAVRNAIAAHDVEIASWLDGPPQTNEPGRSSAFMAGLLALAARLGRTGLGVELLEIGSSAGLNLLMDRYRYDLDGVIVGPADAEVILRPEWRGPPPPAAAVRIESIRGVDIAPIDLTDPAAGERLIAYAWADQKERLTRLERAIALARAHPPRLEQGDAADWVEARLAEPQPEGAARMLMHSIVWQYLPADGQRRIEAAMAAAAARATPDRPLGWLAYEADRQRNHISLALRYWPGGGETVELASLHPHGAWIEWRPA